MEETGNNCENMLHSIKGELNPAETYQLLKILQPYAATIRKTVLSQSGEWMSEYLQAHISDDYAGILHQKQKDNEELLARLPITAQAKCLMEANGYRAVLVGELTQKKEDCGVIIFNPEGKPLITINQFQEEWNRLNKKAGTGIEVKRENENANQQGEKIAPENQVNAGNFQVRDVTVQNCMNVEAYAPIIGVDGQPLHLYSIDQWEEDPNWDKALRHSDNESRMNRADLTRSGDNIQFYGRCWCIYNEREGNSNSLRLSVAVPCFTRVLPTPEEFIDSVNLYKSYILTNSGRDYREKSLDPSVFAYKYAMMRYIYIQWARLWQTKMMKTYIAQIREPLALSGAAERMQSALENFFGIANCNKQPIPKEIDSSDVKNARWIEGRFCEELAKEETSFISPGMKSVVELLGYCTGYQPAAALKLLELIGSSFLGKNFRKDACNEKAQVSLVIANQPVQVASLLQEIIEAGQLAFYTEAPLRGTNNGSLNELNESLEQRREEGSVVRSDLLEYLMENRVPAYILDRYFGAEVNITADIGDYCFLPTGSFNRSFVTDLISGNRVPVPVADDPNRVTQKFKQFISAQRSSGIPNMNRLNFRSNLKYIFTTPKGFELQFLDKLRIKENKVDSIWLDDDLHDVDFRRYKYRNSISFIILMLALYYVIDRRLLNRSWTQECETIASKNSDELHSVLTNDIVDCFWKECCCDHTADVSDGWKKDPDLDKYNGTDADALKARRAFQKERGIDQLPTSSRSDIYYAFELWCLVNNITPQMKIDDKDLMKLLGKNLKPAQILDKNNKTCETIFYCRISVKNQYSDKEIAKYVDSKKFTQSKNKGNQTRVYYGLTLNPEAVDALQKKWSEKQDEAYSVEKKERFMNWMDALIEQVRSEVMGSMDNFSFPWEEK